MKRKVWIALIGSLCMVLSSCENVSYAAQEEGGEVTAQQSMQDAADMEEEGPDLSYTQETSSPEPALEEEAQADTAAPSDTEQAPTQPSAGMQAAEDIAGEEPETDPPQPQPVETETAALSLSDLPEETANGEDTLQTDDPEEEETVPELPETKAQPETVPEDTVEGTSEEEDPPEYEEGGFYEEDSETEEPSGTESETIDLFGELGEEELTEETEDLLEIEEEELTEVESEEEVVLSGQQAMVTGSFSGYTGTGYYWDESWFISPDFRFTQIEKEYALVASSAGIFVYEEAKEDAAKVGQIPYGGVVCILKKMKDGWDYIECGDIRGFAKEDALTADDTAGKMVDLVGERYLTQGKLLCEKADNAAFTFTKTTSYPVIAKKVYALAKCADWIYEYPDQASRFVGDVSDGSLVYLLGEAKDGWFFAESGDVRGFIRSEAFLTGKKAETIVKEKGEGNVSLAEQLIKPEENRSVYYTLRSVKSAGGDLGASICRSASALVGKLPYVYGGTSLETGCDCSGFTQAVFAGYGIALPRTAQEQGCSGQAVLSMEDAKPGDIIYYSSGPHVGIYMGGGMVVECSGNESNTAANPGKGPMVREADYMPVTSIRR